MIDMYGIPNCGSIKKARDWLDAHQLSYRFHNVKKEGVSEDQLRQWMQHVPWSTLLNKRGLTWRQLDAADKDDLDEAKATALLAANPTMIKRPVLVDGERVIVGFDSALYQRHLIR